VVWNATVGGYDGLGELVLNGQLSLADETITPMYGGGMLWIYWNPLLFAAAAVNLAIILKRRRAL
jgi:hypothetical protein